MQLIHDFEHQLAAEGRGGLGPLNQMAVQISCSIAANPIPGITVNLDAFTAGLWKTYGSTAPKLSKDERSKAHAKHVKKYLPRRGWDGATTLVAVCPDVPSEMAV